MPMATTVSVGPQRYQMAVSPTIDHTDRVLVAIASLPQQCRLTTLCVSLNVSARTFRRQLLAGCVDTIANARHQRQQQMATLLKALLDQPLAYFARLQAALASSAQITRK